jgi:hypothetical protein
MTEVIYKYRIDPVFGEHKLRIYRNAKILSVQVQRSGDFRMPDLCIWALVNPENKTEIRTSTARTCCGTCLYRQT